MPTGTYHKLDGRTGVCRYCRQTFPLKQETQRFCCRHHSRVWWGRYYKRLRDIALAALDAAARTADERGVGDPGLMTRTSQINQ